MNETLYRKVGRRYVPVLDCDLRDGRDMMRVGTFRLTYCYSEGGRRYSYDVRPDTAGFVAAAEMAAEAMERAIAERAVAVPSGPVPYTKAQIKVLDRMRDELAEVGVTRPMWWQHASARDIAAAGIKAVREWKE